MVCDFVFPAQNVPHMDHSVLFQHNVETVIGAGIRKTPAAGRAGLFRTQAKRMFRYEDAICHQARHIVTVSETDSETTRRLFGLSKNVSAVPTGVDCDYFAPPASAEPYRDLIFVGAMNWTPNIDGMRFFMENIWPRIRAAHPKCTLGIVGRAPHPKFVASPARFGLGCSTFSSSSIRSSNSIPDRFNSSIRMVLSRST